MKQSFPNSFLRGKRKILFPGEECFLDRSENFYLVRGMKLLCGWGNKSLLGGFFLVGEDEKIFG